MLGLPADRRLIRDSAGVVAAAAAAQDLAELALRYYEGIGQEALKKF